MPQQLFYSNQGLQVLTGSIMPALAVGKIRLFKSGFTPDITTTVADLVENEANYSGYAAGGIAVAEWNGPYFAPEGGMAIQTPSVDFSTATTVTVPNLIGGWWFQDDNNSAVVIAEFGDPQPMQVPYQVLTIQVRLVFPN